MQEETWDTDYGQAGYWGHNPCVYAALHSIPCGLLLTGKELDAVRCSHAKAQGTAHSTRDALMKASTAFTCEYEVPQLPLLSKQTCQLADRAMLGKVALHQNAACVGSMQLQYNSRTTAASVHCMVLNLVLVAFRTQR